MNRPTPVKGAPASRGRIMLLYIQRLGTGNLYQVTEPLGLKTLAAYVEDKGYLARVFSGSAHEAASAIREEMASGGLDVVGLYCDYENRSVVESFGRKAKEEWGLRVLVGGPQTMALGADFLIASGADAMVHREGEYTLLELLEHLLHGRGSLADIRGISYLESDGRLQTTPPRPPIADLDTLPLRAPGRDCAAGGRETLSLLTGRGCPFKCAFCYEGSVPGKVRLRSVAHVMREIRQGLEENPGLRFLWFADDTFTLNRKRVEEFSRELAGLRREHDFVWFCECHPNTLVRWPDILPLMLEAGLVRMQIGIETGSAKVMKLYNKQTTLEQIARVVEMCREGGLPQLVGNMIFGGAAESRETFRESKDFAARLLSLGPGMLEITSTYFMPFPGTAITTNPEAYGLELLDPESLTSKNDVAVTRTAELTREEITAMRTEFTWHALGEMNRLFREGRIPEARILADYRLRSRYGMESGWLTNVYASDPVRDRYYTLLAGGGYAAPEDVPADRRMEARPRRTVRLREGLEAGAEGLSLYGEPLAEEDLELLLLADGRRTLGEVRERMGLGKENGREEFGHRLGGLQRRRWLVYAEDGGEGTEPGDPGAAPPSGPGLAAWAGGVKVLDLPGGGDPEPARVREMAPTGLAAVRAALPLMAGAGTGAFWPGLEETLEACRAADIPLVRGRLILSGNSLKLEPLDRVLECLAGLMKSFPGFFEVEPEPLLQTAGGGVVSLADFEERWEEFREFDPREVFAAGRRVRAGLAQAMRDILERGLIPHEVLLRHFTLQECHGFRSVWLEKVFQRNTRVLNYYIMMSRGAVRRLEEIPPGERERWRPQRTIDLWGAADFSAGFPRIGRQVLSPLEYELLLHSTGKQTLGRVLAAVHSRFRDRFQGWEEFSAAALGILHEFEKRLWLAYAGL